MSIIGSIIQSAGGGGVSDIKDTYKEIETQSGSTYTVTDTGSVLLPVDTTSNAITITPNASPVVGDRLRVYDEAGNCGINIATVTGCGTIQTDYGAMEWRWNGSVWKQIDAVREIIKRNASTNEVTAIEPDTLIANKFKTPSGGLGLEVLNTSGDTVALIDNTGKITARSGEFGIAGVVSDQSVSDGDFTNIGANVDQTVADEFGNALVSQSDDIVTAGDTITGDAPFSLTLAHFIDNINTGSPQFLSGNGTFTIDIGVADITNRFEVFADANNTARNPKSFLIEGSNDNVGFSTIANIDTSNIPSIAELKTWYTYDFSNTTAYRYYRITVNGASYVMFAELRLGRTATATTNNTFDTNLASGTGGTFSPSSFLAYDQNDALINGTGKVNVAYAVDGGAFTSLVDQDTFKALGDIAYTTQFDLQLQLVGSQRFSRATIATPDNTLELTTDGKTLFKESGATFASLGPNGFRPPSLTTAERDAIVSPSAGLTIYNETTNKLNFYNGSAWEAITSS